MDRITLNGEVYVKESNMEKLSDDDILELLTLMCEILPFSKVGWRKESR